MRNMNKEAAIWNLYVSSEFVEAGARESEETMRWFGGEAVEGQVANFGRNNQIYDVFKTLARDLRRGAELAALGDYKLLWDAASCFRGDVRGMMDQPLRSWMSDAEYHEFFDVRIGRISAYTSQIAHAIHNAMVGAESFFNPDPDYPDIADYDGGFPDDDISKFFDSYASVYERQNLKLPNPLPEYQVDRSLACRTGDEVPWTGVWYPDTGLDLHSLTFAIKGLRMQPAYRVTKTEEELWAEGIPGGPETVAVATTWHPLVPTGRAAETSEDLWAKAGAPCPRAGIWQAADPGTAPRAYEAGERMINLGSAYGLTVWRWTAER